MSAGVDQAYRTGREGSAALFERAIRSIAGGVTHDIRHHEPFPIFAARTQGSHKWDVDGNEYVDYTMGHGALLLGHAHPLLTEAVKEQLPKGTHPGASHELEVRWAELICELVPNAHRVRFHSSGTEATQMAMRLARANTGRDRIVKFHYHFHGWHDYATIAVDDPLDVPSSAGVPAATAGTVTALPTDLQAVRDELDRGDVAAVIVEPSGAGGGRLPLDATFAEGLRSLCDASDTLLIFDEVVTGFRMSQGGFQRLHGVTPDLTTMAKIVAGGMPGAAVAGRADLMERLEFRDEDGWNRGERVSHQGTFNANPLSAAAGVAMLQYIADGSVHAKVNAAADRLRGELQTVFDRHDLGALVYGETSYWHVSLSGRPERNGLGGPAGAALKRALLSHGVHLQGAGGFVCSEHTDDDVDRTVTAFDAGIQDVIADGLLKP